MGSFLDKPKTEKESAVTVGGGLSIAVSAMQGWRVDMEDAHAVQLAVDGLSDTHFFAVFDGHGGSLVSRHSSAHVLNKILSTDSWKLDAKNPTNIGNAMIKGFLEIDEDLRKLPEVVRGDDHSGSTAIAAFLTGTHVIVANCGDSRSVLVRANEAIEMSVDHKPYLEAEQKRIEAAGGSVTMRRVNGDLAVSRALGDFVYKHQADLPAVEQQVSAEPEIKVEERTDKDQYLVLACDGIWDVMTNQDVANFVVKAVNDIRATGRDTTTNDLKSIAEGMLDDCLGRGSRDNMSVVIVALPGAGVFVPVTPSNSSEVHSASATVGSA